MGTEKTVVDRHEYAALQIEGLLRITPPRSPARYRQEDTHEPEHGPMLHCGKKCVVRVSEGLNIIGYMLCRIVSWDERETNWWSGRTTIYLTAEATSSEKLEGRIGKLFHATYFTHGPRKWSSLRGIVSFDPADMPRRPVVTP